MAITEPETAEALLFFVAVRRRFDYECGTRRREPSRSLSPSLPGERGRTQTLTGSGITRHTGRPGDLVSTLQLDYDALWLQSKWQLQRQWCVWLIKGARSPIAAVAVSPGLHLNNRYQFHPSKVLCCIDSADGRLEQLLMFCEFGRLRFLSFGIDARKRETCAFYGPEKIVRLTKTEV